MRRRLLDRRQKRLPFVLRVPNPGQKGVLRWHKVKTTDPDWTECNIPIYPQWERSAGPPPTGVTMCHWCFPVGRKDQEVVH